MRNVRGSSYVEVLMAVALIGMAFGPLLGLVINGRRSGDLAVLYARAAVAAESRLEQVRALPYDRVESVGVTAVDQVLVDGERGWNWELIVTEIEPGIKDVTVIVIREAPAVQVQMSTSVSRR